MMSLLDEEASDSELEIIESYATALEVEPDEFENLRQMINDQTHLLSGYGTDPEGESLAASFSAGNRGKNPFTYIFFVLCQFHLGMRFSGFAPSATGAFDARKALWAARRGMEVNIDLTQEWDYWADLGLSLDQARAKLGMTLPLEGPDADS